MIVLAATLVALAQTVSVQQQGELRWACGGVGADERAELERIGAGANLEVLFVSARRGAYLSGARLSVEPAAGGAVQIEADGPICYVAGPPGTYRLRARLDGVERSATARVPAPGAPAARAVLAFPDEPWDGIRATEEEKRQGREVSLLR